ncbi:MAG: tRNA (guanosine(18)-2'-O)-methyltransferase TrmH [Pseudomonadota bacterium]
MTPERLSRLRAALAARQPDLTVITHFLHKQRNTSAIVRICDGVGIRRLHAVVTEADYQAFQGTAMGSHNWVEVLRHRCLADATVKLPGYQLLAAHPAANARDYRDVDYTLPTALLLGTEKAGLDAEAVAMADHCIAIPMRGMVTSYNVSVAAGIILAEAQRQREAAGLYDRCRLDSAEYQRLLFEWAHPQVRDFCLSRGLDYPPLNEEAEIVDGPAWYARVREQLEEEAKL